MLNNSTIFYRQLMQGDSGDLLFTNKS